MSQPYITQEKLVEQCGLRDVLLMIKDICDLNKQLLMVNSPGQSKAWDRSSVIIASAVYKLPKSPGIK